MDKEYGSFRKAAFGGFNRKDVIDYIEKMRNEYYEYKKEVEETVRSLNKIINELQGAAMISDIPAVSEAEAVFDEPCTESFGEIGQAGEHLKTVADELSRSLGDFMDKLSEKGLFEKAQEDYSEAEEALPEKEISFVDGVLASISYFDEATPAVKEKAAEKTANLSDITEILLDFGFIE